MRVCPECQSHTISSEALCRERLCPTCARILSTQHLKEAAKAIEYAVCDMYEAGEAVEIRFLTLTIRNTTLSDLREGIKTITEGFKRLMRRKRFEKVVGYVRSVEITYNAKEKTYHPHIHAIIISTLGGFIPHADLIGEWRQAARLDYAPSVRVNMVKPKAGKSMAEATVEATVECCKYALKTTQIATAENIRELSEQICKMRFLAYGGKVKENIKAARADIRAAKAETRECRKCGARVEIVRGEWNGKEYVL